MKLKTFTLVVFLIFTGCSVFAKLNDVKPSIAIANQLYEKSKKLIPVSIDSSHYYANQVSEIARELGDKEYLAKSYFLQGYLYLLEKETAKGIKYLLRSRLIYQQLGDLEQEQRLLDNVVNIAIENHVFTIGEYYANKRLKMLDKIDDYKVRSDIYADMGYIYMNNDMLTHSKKYFAKAKIELDKNIDVVDTVFYSKILRVLGVVNRRIYEKKNDNNHIYLEQAKELHEHSIKVNTSLANRAQFANNMGFISLSEGDYDNAFKYLNDALTLKQQLGSNSLLITSLNNMGQFYFKIDKLDSAFTYFSKAVFLNVQEKNIASHQYDRSISVNLYTTDELKKSLKYLDVIKQTAPQLTLENSETINEYLNLQIERIQALKQIEVNEMLQEVNVDIQKEIELANSKVTAIDWLIYISGGLSFLALIGVLYKLRSIHMFNRQRREHNKKIIDEIRKGDFKE